MQRLGMAGRRWARACAAVAIAMVLAGCLDTTTGPGNVQGAGVAGASLEVAGQGGTGVVARAPDLGTCTNIALPEAGTVSSHAYASGVQVYQWTGTSWSFVAPLARLFADAGERGQVGTHYAGPTWESNSGSTVVAAVVDRCTADPSAIPWLVLRAVTTSGPGIFHRVTYIHRVNTVGGLAPTTPGNVPGEVANVPYTAEYVFYRAR